MTDAERNGTRKILWRKRIGTLLLPLLGLCIASVAALGYHDYTMLSLAVAVFLLAGAMNILYMFSLCPRCHRRFNSLRNSRFGLIWPGDKCRHCGLPLCQNTSEEITPRV